MARVRQNGLMCERYVLSKATGAHRLGPDLCGSNHIQDLLDSLREPTLAPGIVSSPAHSVRNRPEIIETVS